MLKRLIIASLLLCLVATSTACDSSSTSSTSSDVGESTSSDVTPTAEPTEQPSSEQSEESEESSEESQVESSDSEEHEAHNQLPATEGSVEFIAAFENNIIDTKYLGDLSTATTITEMVAITTTATADWEREINFVYTKLMELVPEDSRATEEAEQTAWANDLPIVTAEIQESTQDAGSSGKLQASYETMLVYRDRAIALHSKVFSYTSTVEFAPDSSEVVG